MRLPSSKLLLGAIVEAFSVIQDQRHSALSEVVQQGGHRRSVTDRPERTGSTTHCLSASSCSNLLIRRRCGDTKSSKQRWVSDPEAQAPRTCQTDLCASEPVSGASKPPASYPEMPSQRCWLESLAALACDLSLLPPWASARMGQSSAG